ncbi:MAG: stage II sporulation protein D [Clostridia bacterium]|nr:stage II sporulation protein D [Clostridia bacterium]
MICFFLSLAMILCPLCAVENVNNVFSNGNTEDSETVEVVETVDVSTVKVMSVSSKNITEMTLNDYLLGVVAAEINPTYHEETIKAQTIASHTLLLYVKNHKNEALQNADITDDSTQHQAFLTVEQQKEKWGENYDLYVSKISKCIDEVINLVLLYNGEYINSVFHSMSNGRTENAKDVWGGDYPYLQSVPSVGDTLSPAHISTVSVSVKDFEDKIKTQGIKTDDKPEKWIKEITHTDTGMVKTIKIGDKELKGTDIRTLFQLKSSTFTLEYKDEKFVFTVKGYGHGVGMSQYGANHMASQGFNYEQILKHYYNEIEIKEI